MNRVEENGKDEEVLVVNQNTWRKFVAHQELRLKFLDKDVYLTEKSSWIRDLKSYIDMGYNGEVPKKEPVHSVKILTI